MAPRILSIAISSSLTAAALAITLSGNAVAEEPTAPAANAAAVAAPPQSESAPPRLDLKAPDIAQVLTTEQIDRVLAATYRNENIEEVEVEGDRDRDDHVTPDVWGGLFAPFWAVLNPKQAWRILLPLPPDQTRDRQDEHYDATDPYNARKPTEVLNEPEYLRR